MNIIRSIIYTIAVRTLGHPVAINTKVSNKIRDVVIDELALSFESKIRSDDDAPDWEEIDEEDHLGRMWKHISIDGALLIDRDRKTIDKIADVIRNRITETEPEIIEVSWGDFEWDDNFGDSIYDLSNENLLPT